MLHIFIDADACPVKPEVYRVAGRCGLKVTLVANAWMRVPKDRWIELEVVTGAFNAADDWIVEHVQPLDIVVTADILLASRCVKAGARAIGPSGKLFTEDNIGQAVATRDLLSELRGTGEITGGPPPCNSVIGRVFCNSSTRSSRPFVGGNPHHHLSKALTAATKMRAAGNPGEGYFSKNPGSALLW